MGVCVAVAITIVAWKTMGVRVVSHVKVTFLYLSLQRLPLFFPHLWSCIDISDILPTVPIPQTDVSGFSYTNDAFDFICALDEAATEQKGSHPYIELTEA